jgi:4-hydroxybenzoate polyprenyltransferase
MNDRLNTDIEIPLVVDLDGTLLLTDTIVENFSVLLFRHPLAALVALRKLTNRAAFKRELASHTVPDVPHLPQRQDLIRLIGDERARGRTIHLVTAADQKIANEVAASIDLFDSVWGSNGIANLKGETKLAHLQHLFPQGFIYAGDSAADLPIFKASKGAILCDVTDDVTAAISASGVPVLRKLSMPAANLLHWLHAFRPHQWSKNALIFVPLFIGHEFQSLLSILASVGGFLLLSILTSGTYLLNDIADLSADRRHPTKNLRPFASGRLSLAGGLFVGPLMILAAIVGAALLSWAFAIFLVAYLALTMSYSLGLKRLPLTDVFIIGSLFTLRIMMGAAVIGLGQSAWLLSFSLAFFVSLALAKRHVEIVATAPSDMGEIAGRGYRSSDWPLTLTFGVGTGLFSLIVMLLYLANDAAPSGFYHRTGLLYVIPGIMLLWLMRIWLKSHRGELHDDPVLFALKDPISLLYGIGVAIVFFLAI